MYIAPNKSDLSEMRLNGLLGFDFGDMQDNPEDAEYDNLQFWPSPCAVSLHPIRQLPRKDLRDHQFQEI